MKGAALCAPGCAFEASKLVGQQQHLRPGASGVEGGRSVPGRPPGFPSAGGTSRRVVKMTVPPHLPPRRGLNLAEGRSPRAQERRTSYLLTPNVETVMLKSRPVKP